VAAPEAALRAGRGSEDGEALIDACVGSRTEPGATDVTVRPRVYGMMQAERRMDPDWRDGGLLGVVGVLCMPRSLGRGSVAGWRGAT
jgi:hypothetical protein